MHRYTCRFVLVFFMLALPSTSWSAEANQKGQAEDQQVNLGIDLDYLRIQTTGTHRWTDSAYGADMSWTNGARVWSEQISATMSLQYIF